MSSKRVVGTISRLPIIGAPLRNVQKGQKTKLRAAERRASELEAAEAKREGEVATASEEAKERARRRTIFSGGDIERNIFRRTLGSGAGTTQTLGA